MLTDFLRSALKEEIKKIMKQPGYDDGSAGPVLVRYAGIA